MTSLVLWNIYFYALYISKTYSQFKVTISMLKVSNIQQLSDQIFRACTCILFPSLATSTQLIGIVVDGMLLFHWLFLVSLAKFSQKFFNENWSDKLTNIIGHCNIGYSHFDTKLFFEFENDIFTCICNIWKESNRDIDTQQDCE